MLYDYVAHTDIESDVRRLLKAKGHADTSTQACKIWARTYVQSLLPRWRPGWTLTWEQQQWVGQHFLALVQEYCGPKEETDDDRRASCGRVNSGIRVPNQEA